jgi:hypothetical protein
MILGGILDQRFEQLQHIIQELSCDDEDNVDVDDKLQNYNDLLKNIKWVNIIQGTNQLVSIRRNNKCELC